MSEEKFIQCQAPVITLLPSWDNVQQVPSAEKHSTGAVHGKRTYYQHVADTQVLGEKRRKTLSLRTSGEV